jgi:hypothetical protein
MIRMGVCSENEPNSETFMQVEFLDGFIFLSPPIDDAQRSIWKLECASITDTLTYAKNMKCRHARFPK